MATARSVTRRRCCRTGKVLVAGGFDLSRWQISKRGTIRSGDWDVDGDRQPWHCARFGTRRRCCRMARCWWPAVASINGTLEQARNYTIRRLGTWTATGSIGHRTRLAHGDVAAKRAGAGGRRLRFGDCRARNYRSGDRSVDGDCSTGHCTRLLYGDVAAQWAGLVAGEPLARSRTTPLSTQYRRQNCTIVGWELDGHCETFPGEH